MSSLLLGLALAVAAPQAKDAPKKDPPALVGEWAVDGILVDGTPKRLPAGTTWTFTADGKAVLRLGRPTAVDEGTYTADPKKDPPEADIQLGERTSRAIYRRDGDKLTLCMALGDADRPTGFDAPAGSNAALWTLKRVKPKD